MQKDTAVIPEGQASVLSLDSETVITSQRSVGFYFDKTISNLTFGIKSAVIACVIVVKECKKYPQYKRDQKAKEYWTGFATRCKYAMDFMIGGERLMSAMKTSTKHPKEVQLNLLHQILKTNAETVFGKEHLFDVTDTVEKYQANVPVNTYDNLASYINRHLQGEADVLVPGKPCYYATTSGSTGAPKYIPVTETMAKKGHQGSARLWSYTLYNNEPRSYTGKIIVLVSPAVEGHTESGTPFGSISGQYIKNLNQHIQANYAIPYELYEEADYESRYYCILLLGMAEPNVSLLSSTNPSTLSLLGEKGNLHKARLIEDIRTGTLSPECKVSAAGRALVESRLSANPERADYLSQCYLSDPEEMLRPTHYWQNLVVISCWTGGNSKVFLERMKQWYGKVKIKDLGYLASEIRGSVPLGINSSEGVLTVDENFFEFLEEGTNPQTADRFLLVHELEVGKRYQLYFTNQAGLYRYDINDIIEVKGFVNQTPTIDFIQKGKGVTNITGEKIYEQQVLSVIERASDLTGLEVIYFQVQARMQESRYELYCEFEQRALSDAVLKQFLSTVEDLMQSTNMEYKTKRKSLRLEPFTLHVLGENSFERFRKWRVANGVREAQIKSVPLTADISLIEPLEVINSVSTELDACAS